MIITRGGPCNHSSRALPTSGTKSTEVSKASLYFLKVPLEQTEDCAELQLLNLSQNHVCTLP